jgi:hypothetical protein
LGLIVGEANLENAVGMASAEPATPGRRFPLLLAALMATTALSIDMSLPAMPEIA